MKKIPDESVDLIFADPPYFGGQKKNIIPRYDGYSGNKFSTGKAAWAFPKSLEYQLDFARAWLGECKRLLKKGSTIWITGTYHSIGVINVVLQQLRFHMLNDIILYKKNAPPNFRGSSFRHCTETMLWAKKGKEGRTKFNYTAMKVMNGGRQMNNVWEYVATKRKFWYPAAKDESILEKVILAGSHEGDVVLDPFGGSGTTAVVADRLKRKWVVIEKEKKYCSLIKRRLNGEV